MIPKEPLFIINQIIEIGRNPYLFINKFLKVSYLFNTINLSRYIIFSKVFCKTIYNLKENKIVRRNLSPSQCFNNLKVYI